MGAVTVASPGRRVKRKKAGRALALGREIQLYKPAGLCNADGCMRNFIRLFSLTAALALTGCTGTLTNLSPQYQTRRADGLYPLAVAFDTRQASLRWSSIKPYVVVGDKFYPMRPMPLMTNRWETLLAVPADTGVVHYRYKLEWQYNAIPVPQNDSQISKLQTLKIIDR